MASYREPVPETFGKLSWMHGLMFTCMGCTRATMMERADLVRKWGEEGRVSEIAARFSCSNCKAKRRRLPGVRIEVVRAYRSAPQAKREKITDPIDMLAYDIANLKPKHRIS